MSGSHNFQLQQSSAVMRLPVWRTVTRSYALTADNLGQFARMSLLPFLIMVPLSMVATSLVAAWQPQDPHAGMTLMTRVVLAVPNLVTLPFLASIAVYWHNLVLRDERVTGWLNLRSDTTVWNYAALGLALDLLAYLPMVLHGRDTPGDRLVGSVVAMAVMWFILPRLALTLPATAIGQRLHLTMAWQVTRGNSFRLGVAMLLTLLPPAMLLGLGIAFLKRSAHLSALAVLPFAVVAGALAIVISLTTLSLAFEFFVPLRYRLPAAYRGRGI